MCFKKLIALQFKMRSEALLDEIWEKSIVKTEIQNTYYKSSRVRPNIKRLDEGEKNVSRIRGFYRVEWSADMIARHRCGANRFLLNKIFSYLVLKEVLKDFYSINSIKSRFPCGKSYFSSEVLFEKYWLNIGVESYILWGFVGQEIQIPYSQCYFCLVSLNFWLNVWSF